MYSTEKRQQRQATKWMGGWVSGRVDGCIVVWVDKCVHGCLGGCVAECVSGFEAVCLIPRLSFYVNSHYNNISPCPTLLISRPTIRTR